MRTFLLIVALLSLVGCVAIRESALNISAEEVKNNEVTRQVALNYLSIWPMQSGFIQGALGPRLDELPAQAVEAIDELDRLADQLSITDPNSIEDWDLGLSLGLRVRLLTAVVQEALEMYAPDVLDLIPLLF